MHENKYTPGANYWNFNQYVTGGKGHTIHSALQMEAFGLTVEDKSRLLPNLNSRQAIETPEGHIIP